MRRSWMLALLVGFAWPGCSGAGSSPQDGSAGADGGMVTCTGGAGQPCLRDVVYRTTASGVALTLDYWKPVGADRGPAAIVIHGGGWVGGDKANVDTQASDLSARGFAVFNINYRLHCSTTMDKNVPPMLCDLGPGADSQSHVWTLAHPVPLEDVWAAIDWVASHGTRYGCYYNGSSDQVDTIVALGSSAGGQLALMGAVHSGNPQPFDAVVGLSPAPDFDYCGAVHVAGTDPGTGMTATTGPGGNTCAYDARRLILGGVDYASDMALWRDMSPTANVDGQDRASYFLTNGSGFISPGEFIPFEESQNFANAAHAARADLYIEQYHLDATPTTNDCHADGCWQQSLPASGGLQFAPVSPAPSHFGQTVKEAALDFLWTRATAAATARGDLTQ